MIKRLITVREVLLKVNLAYIASAAQKDDYRTEPPFRLQGSYRNMAKLAAKITAVMTMDEVDALIRDHYRGEAQTLTSGAEENLLKLAQLLGTPSTAESARWNAISEEFRRQKKLGGASDGEARTAALLADISMSLEKLAAVPASDNVAAVTVALAKLGEVIATRVPPITR